MFVSIDACAGLESKDSTMLRGVLVVAAVIATSLCLSGCGDGRSVWVTGKLVKGGAKYNPPEGHLVTVTFVGIELPNESGKVVQAEEAFQAVLDPDSGSFSVPGPEGRGIPPGKYRVAVTQKQKREAFDAAKAKAQIKKGVDRETDTLRNQFGLESSQIIREIKSGGEIVIDLDNPYN
jgi:hypothetical protein